MTLQLDNPTAAGAIEAELEATFGPLERGYQRSDLTEPFGYRDAIRNVVPGTSRAPVAFVHRDGREADEPAWADGGSYMAYMKIRQHPEQFNALPEPERDAVIGRLKDGTRLDLVGHGVEPSQEPDSVPDGLPPTAHVRKAGPRGSNDEVQIDLPARAAVHGDDSGRRAS